MPSRRHGPAVAAARRGLGAHQHLEIDIEGAEEKLFGEKPDAWIERTDSILMEIHSPRAARSVYSAMARHPFAAARYRELHVFVRRPAPAGEPDVRSSRH